MPMLHPTHAAPRAIAALLSAAALSGTSLGAHPGADHAPAAHQGKPFMQDGAEHIPERVHYDFVRPDGSLDGGHFDTVTVRRTDLPTPNLAGPTQRLSANGFVAIPELRNGARTVANNRLEIVFVGDGYTASELGIYAAQVDQFSDEMFSYQPLTNYRALFEVYRVDVVSNESGVDNDPSLGIDRDTALDMRYWCNNIERLLCVNVSKAFSYANTAPGVDQVVALANSSKYGGAGYPGSNIGTASAGSGAAADIVVHELGHALGDLADEYTYGGPTAWPGGEQFDANLSTFPSADMLAQERKWWRWLGASIPGFDGSTSTYQGGGYSVTGVFRPTNNSKMRNLGRPFNLPSSERLIREIYRVVNVVDVATPTSEGPQASDVLFIDPVDLVIDTIEIAWTLNGSPVTGASAGGNAEELDLAALGAVPGDVIQVVVSDETNWVRDESIRDTFMTTTLTWTVAIAQCDADVTTEGLSNGQPDGIVSLSDFSYYLSLWSFGNLNADITSTGVCDFGAGDDTVDLSDFSCYLATWSAGCP
ncbi:MAG: M64 family metallopeptidase [Planctomycetota bacterium]